MTGVQAAGLTAAKRMRPLPRPSRRRRLQGRHAEARANATPSSWRGTSAAASRIAFHYMRDAAEADEAVQDAFVKAYSHLASFREELPFDVWFTRILINGCLDRIKARTRRERWIVPMRRQRRQGRGATVERDFAERVAAGPSPEDSLLRAGAPRQSADGAREAAGAAAVGVHAEP